jgi:1-acyl-sn-glycerol-3-phosphate acyltransferase
MRLLWLVYLKISGWKISDQYPYHLKKFVLIAAPHTSAYDFFLALAVRSYLRIYDIRYLGKEELFKGPFGFIFRKTGGIPVDRFNKNAMVDQVVDLFNQNEKFVIGLSPEGTRKRVERLRTGFYHIAKKANVPIVMAGMDFKNKKITIAPPFYPTDDIDADMKFIINYFADLQGKIPAYGLGHLKTP